MGAGASAGISAAVAAAKVDDLAEVIKTLPAAEREKISMALSKTQPLAKEEAKGDIANIKSLELQDDLKALANLTADALKAHGWGSIDRATIQVQDLSGLGGSKNYKVTATGVDVSEGPSEVALHSRMSELDKKSEERTHTLCRLCGEHGVSPRRLAEGVDWYIEAWEGYGDILIDKAAVMRVVGKELAKMHKLPTDWYDPFREDLKKDFTVLAKVPHASHIWWYSCRMEIIFPASKSDQDFMAEFAQPMFTPQTKAGARMVTCHGDLKEVNMIAMTKGALSPESAEQQIKFADLEFGHVNAACHDLAFVCFHYDDWPMKQVERDGVEVMRRAFLESYLEAMGDPSTEQDVDALLIDTMLAACGHHFGPVGEHCPLFKYGNPEGAEARAEAIEGLKRFKEQAAALQSSPDEQAIFRERGPEGWMASKGYDRLLAPMYPDFSGNFKFFDRIVKLGPGLDTPCRPESP